MSKRFTNIEIDNRGDIILLDDNGVFTVYNLQELEDLLNKQDQRINELESKLDDVTNRLVLMDLPIEFEQWFYTTIAEPSECYDEETLSQITNALLSIDGDGN